MPPESKLGISGVSTLAIIIPASLNISELLWISTAVVMNFLSVLSRAGGKEKEKHTNY